MTATRTPAIRQTVGEARDWYVGAMNDGLFIIDKPPSPSGNDVPPGIYASSPDLILAAAGLSLEQAQAICDAHNAALRAAAAGSGA